MVKDCRVDSILAKRRVTAVRAINVGMSVGMSSRVNVEPPSNYRPLLAEPNLPNATLNVREDTTASIQSSTRVTTILNVHHAHISLLNRVMVTTNRDLFLVIKQVILAVIFVTNP